MAVEIVRTREGSEAELDEYANYNCAGVFPIRPQVVEKLGLPDYTITSIGAYGNPISPERELKVHSWVLMDWPYFRDIVEFGGEETVTKTVTIKWEHRYQFPLKEIVQYIYTRKIRNCWMFNFVAEFGREFRMLDVESKPYPAFEPLLAEEMTSRYADEYRDDYDSDWYREYPVCLRPRSREVDQYAWRKKIGSD